MKKLTYRNDDQIVSDAVKMLLRSNLAWSGSDENMPSKDLDNVRGQLVEAYVDARFSYEEWDALSKEERDECVATANIKFEVAAAEADMKWTAVKVMLDI